MPYKVQDIRKFTEDEGTDSRPYYFCDANVWLAYLVGSDDLSGKREEPYANFFEGIIHINGITDVKSLKRYKFIPKIVVSSLLLSEIFNAYMYKIARPAYLKTKGLTNEDLASFRTKDTYRNTDDYAKNRKLLQAKIETAQNCFIFKDDCFNELNPLELIDNLPKTCDFNDFYYYKWLKHIESEDFKISVVTDDGDFIFEDIEIITLNHDLRQLPKKNK